MQCKQLKEARELSQTVGISRLLVALHSRVVPIGSMCYLSGKNFGALLGSECWCQCLPLSLKTGQTNAKSKTPSKKKVFKQSHQITSRPGRPQMSCTVLKHPSSEDYSSESVWLTPMLDLVS